MGLPTKLLPFLQLFVLDFRSLPSFEDETVCYIVHFEDNNLKPAPIRHENVCVVFVFALTWFPIIRYENNMS